MRPRATLVGVAASLGILAIGAQVGQAVLAQTTLATAPGATTTTAGTSSGTSGTTSTGTAGTSTTTTSGTDGTYTGDSVNTRFGSVQVQVTVSGGQITEVTALHLTDAERKSVQISNRAAPLLRDEVLSAQSANVSTIGGATYTSNAYLSSLQSALDQAGM